MERDAQKDSKMPEDVEVLALLAAQDLPRSAANMVECYDRNFVSVSSAKISAPVTRHLPTQRRLNKASGRSLHIGVNGDEQRGP